MFTRRYFAPLCSEYPHYRSLPSTDLAAHTESALLRTDAAHRISDMIAHILCNPPIDFLPIPMTRDSSEEDLGPSLIPGLNPGKTALIDFACQNLNMRSTADLGAVWGVDGGYSLY